MATFALQKFNSSHQALLKEQTPSQDCGLCIWMQQKMKQLLILQ